MVLHVLTVNGDALIGGIHSWFKVITNLSNTYTVLPVLCYFHEYT